jgi:GNAT superfamily N-acetyltransferase
VLPGPTAKFQHSIAEPGLMCSNWRTLIEKAIQMRGPYAVRAARLDEQRELTRLCVRATRELGYDDAFIDRVMPGLTMTVPLINGGCVQVAEDQDGTVVGVVAVTMTALQSITALHGLYVDPSIWKHGIGRLLFKAAVTRTKAVKAGALMIYAEPTAAGFYERMGAIRVGEGPFFYSPEMVLPHLLYVVPRAD